MSMRTGFAAVLSLALVPTAIPPRAATSAPTEREIVSVFIINATCCLKIDTMMSDAVESINTRLKVEAAALGATFRTVGVSIDAEPGIGREYLRRISQFDQISINGDWQYFTDSAFAWKNGDVDQLIPQVVVYYHDREGGSAAFGAAHIVGIARGTHEIRDWGTRSERILP